MEKKPQIPMYYQIKKDILEKIKNSVYDVGSKIPTDNQFCDMYEVSRITVRRALSELERDGYIERIQGKGTYVKFKEIEQSIDNFYSFSVETRKLGYIPSSIFINLELMVATEEVRSALNLSENEKVYLIERLQLADELIIALDRCYFPEKLIPGFKKDMLSQGSLYQALQENYGFRTNNAEETMEAISISSKDAMKMRISENHPILLVKRISKVDDVSVEYNYRLVNSTIYKYKYNLH